MLATIKHVLDPSVFTHHLFIEIFETALSVETYLNDASRQAALKKILVRNGKPRKFYLLSAPSTRTITSFENSIETLGGVHSWKPIDFSALVKGEAAQSTARILGKFCDCIIVRHDKDDDFAEKMAEAVEKRHMAVSVINAGCGKKHHPTQTILDLYTVYKRYRKQLINGELTYAFVGDLSHSRTIHSALGGLTNFGGTAYTVGPKNENLPAELERQLNESRLKIIKSVNPLDIAGEIDVWYFTRLQKNLRDGKITRKAEKQYAQIYGATQELRKIMRPDSIALHPLPHGLEYPEDIDLVDSRFIHFEQADNGHLARMALLKLMFNPNADLKLMCLEHGNVEVSGTFASVEIPTKDILDLCVTETCPGIRVKHNDWKIKLNSLQKKDELAHLGITRSVCPDCRPQK